MDEGWNGDDKWNSARVAGEKIKGKRLGRRGPRRSIDSLPFLTPSHRCLSRNRPSPRLIHSRRPVLTCFEHHLSFYTSPTGSLSVIASATATCNNELQIDRYRTRRRRPELRAIPRGTGRAVNNGEGWKASWNIPSRKITKKDALPGGGAFFKRLRWILVAVVVNWWNCRVSRSFRSIEGNYNHK